MAVTTCTLFGARCNNDDIPIERREGEEEKIKKKRERK